MRLASIGLNEHEQGLLTQQLKILGTRTSAVWLYLGEAQEADLLIVRNPERVVRSGTALLAHAGARSSRAGDLFLEWPPRMFTLLELLLEAEKRLEVGRSTQACAAEQLAALRQDGWLEIEGRRIVLQPREDRLEATVGSLDELLDLLQVSRLDLMAALHLDLPLDDSLALPFQASLRSVIWALALRSGQRCGRSWNPDNLLFRLAAWPHFGEWEVSPAMLRLTALYTRKPASIATGCQLTGMSEDAVRGFLLACELCQVGVAMSYDKTPPAQPERTVQPGSGLLQSLRARLGISFGRNR